jgi:hypothetical protein
LYARLHHYFTAKDILSTVLCNTGEVLKMCTWQMANVYLSALHSNSRRRAPLQGSRCIRRNSRQRPISWGIRRSCTGNGSNHDLFTHVRTVHSKPARSTPARTQCTLACIYMAHVLLRQLNRYHHTKNESSK